ncbi:2-hydroxyacyl-CoA dehydratase, partial [candidate division FCPU426 bacterium]|nr:2-hydroxyacyl-CoA dehydratase [candidate division FCPU426 bacterium]
IADKHPQQLVDEAERHGLPRNVCTWVKGIHSVIRKLNIHAVVGVVQGDCKHVVSMLESMLPIGVEFIPFSYPYEKNRQLLRWEMQKLMDFFGVQWDDVEVCKKRLDRIRHIAHQIDQMGWQEDRISGQDQLYALINCTDFMGNPEVFKIKLETITDKNTKPYPPSMLRLGILGIPGVFTDLFPYLESLGARVVYHEVARQFAMPEYQKDLLDQNLNYTYPYSFYGRIQDILEQSKLRRLDGYIHYVQSFCHHQLEDMGFRNRLSLPILTLEGDKVGPVDGRTKTRLETFIQVLRQKKQRQG